MDSHGAAGSAKNTSRRLFTGRFDAGREEAVVVRTLATASTSHSPALRRWIKVFASTAAVQLMAVAVRAKVATVVGGLVHMEAMILETVAHIVLTVRRAAAEAVSTEKAADLLAGGLSGTARMGSMMVAHIVLRALQVVEMFKW